jgi:hypothetical protein
VRHYCCDVIYPSVIEHCDVLGKIVFSLLQLRDSFRRLIWYECFLMVLREQCASE